MEGLQSPSILSKEIFFLMLQILTIYFQKIRIQQMTIDTKLRINTYYGHCLLQNILICYSKCILLNKYSNQKTLKGFFEPES